MPPLSQCAAAPARSYRNILLNKPMLQSMYKLQIGASKSSSCDQVPLKP